MIRFNVNGVFPQVLTWAALLAVGSAIALAQEPAPASPSPNPPAAAGQRSDGQIEMDVVHALDASRALKDDLITAATIQSEVTLSGTASSEASKELAESIAGHVPGVTAVHNNLQVGNPQAAAANAPPALVTEQDEAVPPAASEQPMPAADQGPASPPAPYPPLPYQRPQYVQDRPQAPVYQPANGPVTIPQGTLLQVRTSEPVASKSAKDGAPVQFIVIQDVAINGILAIPRGATVYGLVTESKKGGQLAGRSELALALTSLDLGGKNYPMESDEFKVRGPNKAGHTAGNILGGALLGSLIGGAVGRGAGAAIGAGAGAAAGTAASAASPNPGAWIPAEALVDFHLKTPMTVTPVSEQEALRLAQGLNAGGPTLHRRRPYGYGGPYGYANPYPPVFYRPYFFSGGFYYWR